MNAKHKQRLHPVLDHRAFLGGAAVAALPLATSAFGPAARADEPSTGTRLAKGGRLPGVILRQKNPDKAALYTWRFWEHEWRTPERAGRHILMARATDSRGHKQPMACDKVRRDAVISHVLPVEIEVR